MTYDAFISYSHIGDDLFASRLQQAIQRFAKPWWRRRALRVFRDQTVLTANPGLWSSIAAALDESEWLVLLASPDAAQSSWVDREVEYWCERHDPARLLPVLTDGEWVWDADASDFDWSTCTAVPAALRGVFAEEPRHVDMRWARDETQLDLHNGRFRAQVAELAAPIHGLAKDEMEGEDVRVHRRTMRIAWATVAALVLLLAASVVAGAQAVRAADDARASERRAVEARDEADRQASLASANAGEAERRKRDADASAAEAERRKRDADTSAAEAQHQREQAIASASEADRQRAEADRNAATAEAQRRLADQANRDLALTVDQLTDTNTRLDRANSDLADANSDLANANTELDETNRALDDTNRALDDTNNELRATNEQLRTANDVLESQAANLDASRLAALANEQAANRLDLALLLAAQAQRRAATDDRIPQRTLFGLLEAGARDFDGLLQFRPGGDLPAVTVSPAGERVAVVVDRGLDVVEVSLWLGWPRPGTPPTTLTVALPHGGRVMKATFGAGGHALFIEVGLEVRIDPNAPPEFFASGTHVIDADSGAELVSFAPDASGRTVFSEDHRYAAVQTCIPARQAGCEPTVALIDARTGAVVRERPGALVSSLGGSGATSSGATPDADFSPAGDHVLVFAPPGEFQLWPVATPNTTISLYTPPQGTFAIPAFDHGGAVVVGSAMRGQIELYDVDDGSVVGTRALGNHDAVLRLASTNGGAAVGVLQAGRLLVIAGGDPTPIDVAGCADDLVLSPLGQWLVVGGRACDDTDMVELASGRLVRSAGRNVAVMSTDGSHEDIAYQHQPASGAFDESGSFGMLDLADGRVIEVRRGVTAFLDPVVDRSSKVVLVGFGREAIMTVWSPDAPTRTLAGSGSYVAVVPGTARVVAVDTTGSIALWDLAASASVLPIGTIPTPHSYGGSPVADVAAISPAGDVFAAVSLHDESRFEIAHLRSGTVQAEVAVPDGSRVDDLTYSPDGATLFVATNSGVTLLYDVGRQVWSSQLPGVLTALSPNGRYAVTIAHGPDLLRVMDVATGQELAVFPVAVGGIFGQVVPATTAVTSDGRLVVFSETVRDVQTGHVVKRLSVDLGQRLEAVAFDHAGDRLFQVTGLAGQGSLTVLDTATRETLGGRELGRATPSLLSHHPLRLSPDDTLVYAGGELFHTLDLTPVGMLSSMLPAGGNAAGASFTEDGTRLLLAWNNSVYEFTVDGRSLADRACALAGRNLTAAERALFASPASPACAQWPSEP